jgi:hypothetical protein
MSQPNPTPENQPENIIELQEQPEVQPKPAIPPRQLREIKHVNYSKFFGEEQDNSEDYQPEESSQKAETTKKRQRPRSVAKAESTNKKKKVENTENAANKMELEENKPQEETPKEAENVDKNNKNNNFFGTIVDVAEILRRYIPQDQNQTANPTPGENNTPVVNNVNNISIPNSELILIMLEVCLNSTQYGIDKDNSSRAFWEEIGKLDLLKPITTKFKPETLRKYWRTIREAKKYRKIITETRRYRTELDNPNLKLLSSIKIICEYVSNSSHRKFEYFLNKHLPPVKVKKITVEEMTPDEQINDILSTFKKCFPRKKDKEILEVLYMTSFDIENTYLVLKDRENLSFLLFSEKDDEIVSKSWEEKNETGEDYQDVINIKGLEEVLRRKEFLFNVKIDREEYNKAEEIVEEENDENNNNEQGENKDENQNADKKDDKENNDETKGKNENIDKAEAKDDKDKKEDEKKE